MRRDVDPWYTTAPCHDHPDADTLFFPTRTNGAAYQRSSRVALTLCHGCPVRDECLADALLREGDLPATMRFGLYGGLTPDERANLATRQRAS